MESKEVIIARLVLGYLRGERCRDAYKAFLKGSRHLQRCNLNNFSKSKFIPTRYVGLTLEDVLSEYFEIYHIVQGRLETTNYFNEHHHKSNLVDQLMYLLHNVGFSRTSTPVLRSPHVDINIDETSQSYIDQTSDVEATTIYNLPGNNVNGKAKVNANKKSLETKEVSSSVEEASSGEQGEGESIVVNTEVLTQTLLENREFHEKMAETINKVTGTQSAELDETIKAIVKKTEKDPMFDKILDEIIESVNIGAIEEKSGTSKSNIKTESKTKQPVRKQSPKENINTKVTEDQSQNKQNLPPQNNQNEVIMFNGTLDKYIVSNAVTIEPPTNPLYINTGNNLLMVPPTIPKATPQSPKQYYLINNQPALNCYMPPVILTEQDILSMPTVIVNDDTPLKQKNNSVLIQKQPVTVYPDNKENKVRIPRLSSVKPPATSLTDKNKTGPALEGKSAHKLDTNESVNDKTNPALKNGSDKITVVDLTSSKESKGKSEPTTSTPARRKSPRKTTPKSASHIRNLDFSSPPKVITANMKVDCDNKNQIVKNLFNKDGKLKENNKPWDAELRLSIPTPELTKQTEKKKRKLSGDITTPPKKKKNLGKASEKIKTVKVFKQKEKSKTILSPSKYSANKRNLVADFITPENTREVNTQSIKANRNLIPVLETPSKNSAPPIVETKTPSDITPFSKMLEANLKSVDINNLPTPTIVTPENVYTSPYPARSTDYSTSSSYYQPCDTEEQKMLEAQLKAIEKGCGNNESKKISEHLQIFNKNIIGKKNLSLMKRDRLPMSSSSESDDEEKEDNKKDQSIEMIEKTDNTTVIQQKKVPTSDTPRRRYSLRSRTAKNYKESESRTVTATEPVNQASHKEIDQVELKKDDEVHDVIDKVISETKNDEKLEQVKNNNRAKTKNSNRCVKTRLDTPQKTILKELEEKRKRMVEKLKNKSEVVQSLKLKPKCSSSKFKIKLQPKSKGKSKGKKSNLPRKRSESNSFLHEDLYASDTTDEEIQNKKQCEENCSDVEARNLIEGLKQRGIHLMHNKSQKGKESIKEDTKLIPNVTLNSSQEISYTVKKILDMQTFPEPNCCIVFDETSTSGTVLEVPNNNKPIKTVFVKLYIEELDKDADILLTYTPTTSLFDMLPKFENSSEKEALKDKNVCDNFKKEEVNTDDSCSSKKSTARKDSRKSSEEKKCKSLLKSINLDSFLNNIHGNN